MEEDLIINKVNKLKFYDDYELSSTNYDILNRTIVGDGVINAEGTTLRLYSPSSITVSSTRLQYEYQCDLNWGEGLFFSIKIDNVNGDNISENSFFGLNTAGSGSVSGDCCGIKTDAATSKILFYSNYNSSNLLTTDVTSFFTNISTSYFGKIYIKYDSGELKCYINGVLAASHTTSISSLLFPSFYAADGTGTYAGYAIPIYNIKIRKEVKLLKLV